MAAAKTTRSFGADDHPACPACGKPMSLSRRSPHPEYGSDYEIQTFSCSACGHEETRSSDKAGTPHK